MTGADDAGWADALSRAALALARRFAAGATMWCIAPQWPEHARHVAVEFVHPVIMGTRALPAVAVSGPDLVDTLRPLVRAGDIVAAIGPGDDPAILDVLRRSGAWGLTTLWAGSGPRPPAGAADHVIWSADDDDGDAARDGGLVLGYHVLWELTHVCFEHPGLLSPHDEIVDGDACITCGDEGRVGEIVSVEGSNAATVRVAGSDEPVDVSLVAPVHPGELVLVHAGTAIASLEASRDG